MTIVSENRGKATLSIYHVIEQTTLRVKNVLKFFPHKFQTLSRIFLKIHKFVIVEGSSYYHKVALQPK
jgi:hypothetical protein